MKEKKNKPKGSKPESQQPIAGSNGQILNAQDQMAEELLRGEQLNGAKPRAKLSDDPVLNQEEIERLNSWQRKGIWLEEVMTDAGRLEDDAALIREEGGFMASYTIEEQVQRVSDRIRCAIREFEYANKVKIELMTPLCAFEDITETFKKFVSLPRELRAYGWDREIG